MLGWCKKDMGVTFVYIFYSKDDIKALLSLKMLGGIILNIIIWSVKNGNSQNGRWTNLRL